MEGVGRNNILIVAPKMTSVPQIYTTKAIHNLQIESRNDYNFVEKDFTHLLVHRNSSGEDHRYRGIDPKPLIDAHFYDVLLLRIQQPQQRHCKIEKNQSLNSRSPNQFHHLMFILSNMSYPSPGGMTYASKKYNKMKNICSRGGEPSM